MGSLSDIVSIAVSALTQQVQQPGFGVPLIADYHTRFVERVRWYSGSPAGLTAMLADGFTVNDAAYLAASAIVAQSPAPDRFAIGRRALPPDQQVDITPVVLNSTQYQFDLVGPAGLKATVSFTSDGSATAAEFTAGVVSAINTAAVGIVATDQTTFVRCKAAAAGSWFSVTPKLIERATVKHTHVDPGIATDLAAILTETTDFYGVTLTTQGAAEIVAAAAWIESNKRISVLTSQDTDIPSASAADVATTVKTANQFRTQVAYKRNGDSFYGAALLGSVLCLDPGTVTFWGRKLASQAADTLTESQITFIKNKNAGWFTTYGGIAMSRDGKSAAGDFLDIARDRDYLESRLQTDVFTVLTNSNKIPFTDGGAAAVGGAIKARLLSVMVPENGGAGILARDPAPSVIVPKVSAVAGADRLARKLKPITFSARLAGAIQSAEITGTVTV